MNKQGLNASQAFKLRIKKTFIIIDQLGFIELPELYAKMAIEEGVTERKVDEYLKILKNAKKIVLDENVYDNNVVKFAKSISYINKSNEVVEPLGLDTKEHDEVNFINKLRD